ncbi:hypothetical protein BOX15_Mlig028868g1 [Macrostomum lignano]|uniref:Cilia- and flagella-associated protein 126 n=1 Tax=Macrostomum lignano TaxID=282301 RepID=A0A267EPD1_9PLAT|nr:hypothetical protein BOX15_Mlig028868g1 [Macrostomum lignano]
MSSGFAVNQYDDAFRARRLQQYTVPKQLKEYPSTRAGSTKIIANELGHLLPGVGRSEGSPWGDFKGTWDCRTVCLATT